jgi:Ca2+/Na+ antiporter
MRIYEVQGLSVQVVRTFFYNSHMRRWLLILLIALLPLQFTWAATAAYCQHERAANTQHIGHHEHEHKERAEQSAVKDKSQESSTLGSKASDSDCGYCHLSTVKPVVMAAPKLSEASGLEPLIVMVVRLQTREPDRLERPNWRPA